MRSDHGRGGEQRARRTRMRDPGIGAAGIRDRRRTDADATGHRRTRTDGHRLYGARQSRTRGARGGGQRDLQGDAGHRVVPHVPFPEGVRPVRCGQDERDDHLGRNATQRGSGRMPLHGGYPRHRPLHERGGFRDY